MNRLAALISFCLLLLLPSCLEFDAQEITMRYDAEADRIDFLVVYRGIFYEGGSAKPDLKSALEEYDTVMQKGQAFVWNNWPLKIDAVDPPKTTAALAAHVSVENGKLFEGPTGRLDGYQFVRIHDATKFLQKVNLLLELGVQSALMTGFGGHTFDRDSKELVREFLRDREKMLQIEAGRIVLRLPLSKADFKAVLGKLEDHFVNNMQGEIVRHELVTQRRAADPTDVANTNGGDVAIDGERLTTAIPQSPTFRFFWDNEIAIIRGQELQTVALGTPDNKELTVIKTSNGYYSDNFKKAITERGDDIEVGVPDQEIRRRFDDFLTRDPVLPVELAKKRKVAEAGLDKDR